MKKVEPILNFKTSKPKDKKNENALLAAENKITQGKKSYVPMGIKIKELRTEHEITRSNLSLKLGVSSTYIALIEQGRRGGSDELLLKIEELFKLKPKTLLKLRDSGNKENTEHMEKVEVETEVKAKVELQPVTNHSPEQSSNSSHDPIQLLVNTLLSCDEDYVNQKVPQWLKEIQVVLFDQLTPYKLGDIKQHVIAVTRNWVNEAENGNTFEDGSYQIQGCITQDEQKHFFSLQLNEFALTLNVLHKDRQKVQYFEEWLGTSSINYSMQQTLPYAKTEEKISHYLWFNPQVSIADMYRYLKNLPINIEKMQIKEPRLNWYIQEAI